VGGKKREESKKFYVAVLFRTDRCGNAKLPVYGNGTLGFQVCSKFHTYCGVFGRPLVIEIFSLNPLSSNDL
jgi:hypothetical protein